MKTNKIGISLVALVVTIILLAILAGAAIVSLIDNDVVNSSKDVVAEQELYQVRDVASTAWIKALADLDEATPEEYINYIINFLNSKGYTDKKLDKYIITADMNSVTVNLKDTVVEPDNPGAEPDVPSDT